MRKTLLAVFVVACVLAARAADPAPLPTQSRPDLEKLRSDAAALAAERAKADDVRQSGDESGSDLAKLREKLIDMAKKVESQPAPTHESKSQGHGSNHPKINIDESTRPVDMIRLAMNLYRDNDIEGAERAFRMMEPSQLSREDRAFVRYMTGCSLRRLGKIEEAKTFFRDAAATQQDDPFIAGCAVWQLSLLRSTQELESLLEQQRAKSKSH